ncbi:unnamed protein product [Brassica rapa subsp. narinosa]
MLPGARLVINFLRYIDLSCDVIAHLLKPSVRRQFFLDCNEIADICDNAERIFSSEPTVLQLRAPIKIFGDLMRLFDEYGDYVDRGQHSLETISLLLALKVEYQHNVHLIRGNHEAADINALFGFRVECIERMELNANRPATPTRGGPLQTTKEVLWLRCKVEEEALVHICLLVFHLMFVYRKDEVWRYQRRCKLR